MLEKSTMRVLGIESSCDETAAAVLQDGRIVLSNVVASQVRFHEKYGGVVPEIASRKHVELIVPVVREALESAGTSLDTIDGIAVTRGPGLVGSLLIGLSTAKAVAMARGIPFVGVHHLEGHVASVFLSENRPDFPFVALIVSGGHTDICMVHDYDRMTLIGQTRDDAAGEAFDKAAKLLGIGYPGGVVIDELARSGNPRAVPFPRSMKDSFEFSFSGVKTSLLTYIKKLGRPPLPDEIPDLVASYQEAIVDVLVEKTLRAAKHSSIRQVAVVGGVAANSRLRCRFREDASGEGIRVFIPPTEFCTDNAAMIAVVGHHYLRRGRADSLDVNARSRWPING